MEAELIKEIIKEVADTIERVTAILAVMFIVKSALTLGYNHALLAGGTALIAGLGGYSISRAVEIKRK